MQFKVINKCHILASVKTALVVAPILLLINNYERVFRGELDFMLSLRSFATFVVPFSVSYYSRRQKKIESPDIKE